MAQRFPMRQQLKQHLQIRLHESHEQNNYLQTMCVACLVSVMVKYFRKEFKLLSLKFPYALQGFGNLAPS
jgi:hypothetical protein